MSVNVQTSGAAVNSDRLEYVFHSRELIAALARQLVAGHIEGFIEMMSEFPTEYSDFSSVRSHLISSKDGMEEAISILLEEFRDNLHAAVDCVQIEVTNAVFDSQGLVDANVEITSKP